MNRFVFLFCFAILSAGVWSTSAQPTVGSAFIETVSKRIYDKAADNSTSQHAIKKFCDVEKSAFARRVFIEYGAMFVASKDVKLPDVCYFSDFEATKKFQLTLRTRTILMDGEEIKLQEPAMNALIKVFDEALAVNIRVAPFDGAIAASRNYGDTVVIWNSRFEPALKYWVQRGGIAPDEATQVVTLPIEHRVGKIIEWESRGMWFGTGRSGSIFSSTAPPGSSQHLSLLAFDVAGRPSAQLISILNANGWFQTVKGDSQHFTYLGLKETELMVRGLRPFYSGGMKYWIPDLAFSQVPVRPD